MLRLSKKHHIHKMSADNAPSLYVKPNTRFVVETWDALKGRAEEFFINKTPSEEIFTFANPATGPIFIEDAFPGDILEVTIHDIRLDKQGYIKVKKEQITHQSIPTEWEHLNIKVDGDRLFANGVALPCEPMVGVIGTAPKPNEDRWCKEAGDHGGNLDTRLIKKGAILYLPVFTDGALLSLGDIHAAMGDGEVFGQGIEIAAEVELTVAVKKDLSIRRPMVFIDDLISCIASHEDIYRAKELVLKDMGDYLTSHCNMSSDDAYSLMAFYGNLSFCQIVNPQKTVRIDIHNRYLSLFQN